MQWRKLNVKQEQKRRLKPSGLANPQRKLSPTLQMQSAQQQDRTGLTSQRSANNSPQSPSLAVAPSMAARNSMPERDNNMRISNGQHAMKNIDSGWINPDLQNMSQSFELIPSANFSGEVELDNRLKQGNHSLPQGNASSSEDISRIVPDSIQIQLKLRGLREDHSRQHYEGGTPFRRGKPTGSGDNTGTHTERMDDHSSMRETFTDNLDAELERQVH